MIRTKFKTETKTSFIQKAMIIHNNFYNYNHFNYTNNRTKVTITCPVHGDFLQTPRGHLQGQGCFKCGLEESKTKRSNTTEEFIKKAISVHGDKYDYSKVVYTNNRTKVTITCPVHGDFLQKPYNHLLGKDCIKCGYMRVSNFRLKEQNKILEKMSKVHNNLYCYKESVYKGTHKKIKIKCFTHGFYYQSPANHIKGHGCPKCGLNRTLSHTRSNREEFIKKATKIHGNDYDYNLVEYINSTEKILIICNKCKICFKQSPMCHLSGQGCRECSESKGEKLITKILKNNGIRYKKQFNIPEMVNSMHKYDFYLPDYNLLIEFQGIQHFKPLEFFGGEEEFKKIKERDIYKKWMAKVTKRYLIYFDYTQIKNKNIHMFENIVINKINKYKK